MSPTFPVRHGAPTVPILVLLTGGSALTINLFLPALPAIAETFGATYTVASLALGAYLALTGLAQLVIGPLSDRYGRRPVLLASMSVFAVASLGAALAQDMNTFLAFRMGQSVAAAGSILSMAMVRDTHDERGAARTLATIAMVMALAPLLGPMLGGVLDTVAGWRAIFWFYAALAAALVVLVALRVGETRPPEAPGSTREPIRELLRDPRFWAPALTTATSRTGFYIFIAGAPLVATRTYGVSSAVVGVYIGSITAGFIAGAALARRLALELAPERLMIAGRLVAAAGPTLALLALAVTPLPSLLYFAATICVGLGNGLTIPASNAATLSARPNRAGSAAGIEGALTVGLGAILTTLTAALLTRGQPAPTLLALILASVLSGLAAVLWAQRLRGAAKAP